MNQPSRSSKYLIKRLFKEYIWRYKLHIYVAMAAMIVAGATAALVPHIVKIVVDEVFINQDQALLYWVAGGTLAIYAVKSVARYLHTLFISYVGTRIIADMQAELFRHFLYSDLSMFHDQSSGKLISRFTNDIQMMRASVSTVITTLFKESVTLMGLIAVMVYHSSVLSVLTCIAFAAAVYPIIRFGKRSRKLSGKTQAELGGFTNQLDDIFSGVRTVKSYNQEDYEITRANATIDRLFKLYFKSAKVQALTSPTIELISGVAFAVIIIYGGNQVMMGNTTTGTFSAFVTAFFVAYQPMKALSNLNNALQEGLAAADRYFTAIDSKPQIHDQRDASSLQITQGRIEFDHVGFHYEQDGGGVEDFSLIIEPGQKIALVGASGGGKSTMMNLLMRFYDTDSGTILIDGQDITAVTQKSLRGAFAFVPQEAMLFDDTVLANIAYGRTGASRQDIEAAAQMAAAHEFILALPEGYGTHIGPNGVKLSGGQRQRLAIARAMLKNAPILLLDEATSALDNESERLVQQALDKLMENRTTLMIAHRLTTIQHADKIVVLDGGRIVETGTHQQLMDKKAAYFRLQQASHRSESA